MNVLPNQIKRILYLQRESYIGIHSKIGCTSHGRNEDLVLNCEVIIVISKKTSINTNRFKLSERKRKRGRKCSRVKKSTHNRLKIYAFLCTHLCCSFYHFYVSLSRSAKQSVHIYRVIKFSSNYAVSYVA